MGLWTTADDDKLKLLYADRDLSCARIAGHFPGKSRNSIIGRVHRMKLPLRGQARGTRGPHERVRRDRPARVLKIITPRRVQAEMRCAVIEPLNIPPLDLKPNQCHWPYGDGPFTFCGHASFTASSYCLHHQMRSQRSFYHAEITEETREQRRLRTLANMELRRRKQHRGVSI